eukprot:scaffold179932_cov32-Tisochrysis_lutea.AAC.3
MKDDTINRSGKGEREQLRKGGEGGRDSVAGYCFRKIVSGRREKTRGEGRQRRKRRDLSRCLLPPAPSGYLLISLSSLSSTGEHLAVGGSGGPWRKWRERERGEKKGSLVFSRARLETDAKMVRKPTILPVLLLASGGMSLVFNPPVGARTARHVSPLACAAEGN